MIWKKEKYKIQYRTADGIFKYPEISGYTCQISDDLMVGITNRFIYRSDGKFKTRPAGEWYMSILPEGVLFKRFKTRKGAEEFIQAEVENMEKVMRRWREQYGSINDQNEG